MMAIVDSASSGGTRCDITAPSAVSGKPPENRAASTGVASARPGGTLSSFFGDVADGDKISEKTGAWSTMADRRPIAVSEGQG